MLHSGQLRYENVAQGAVVYPTFHTDFFHNVPHHECFLCSKYNGQYEIVLTLALSSEKVQSKEKIETEMNVCKNKRRRDINIYDLTFHFKACAKT